MPDIVKKATEPATKCAVLFRPRRSSWRYWRLGNLSIHSGSPSCRRSRFTFVAISAGLAGETKMPSVAELTSAFTQEIQSNARGLRCAPLDQLQHAAFGDQLAHEPTGVTSKPQLKRGKCADTAIFALQQFVTLERGRAFVARFPFAALSDRPDSENPITPSFR
jgi:hypothetical protein